MWLFELAGTVSQKKQERATKKAMNPLKKVHFYYQNCWGMWNMGFVTFRLRLNSCELIFDCGKFDTNALHLSLSLSLYLYVRLRHGKFLGIIFNASFWIIFRTLIRYCSILQYDENKSSITQWNLVDAREHWKQTHRSPINGEFIRMAID